MSNPQNINLLENIAAQVVKEKSKTGIITCNTEIQNTEDYIKVRDIISNLIVAGLTRMGEGYCISVSDIIFNLLTQSGIKCRLVECQLSFTDKKTNDTHLIGFTTTFQQNGHDRVSTHVVVVTDTEIPMIIDASIAHRLPNGMQAILDKFSDYGNKIFAKIDKYGTTFIYQEKKSGIGIPQLHQISILERITTDKKIFKEIKLLKVLNYIGIFLSSFALINIITKIFLEWKNVL